MRTAKEILQRIEEVKNRDFFGFELSDLLARLSFDEAKPLLNPGATKDDWPEPLPRDRESILKEMFDYMPFAWGKAKNCRGISASRSMSHYNAWAWLAGDDLGDLLNYQYYGKDNLVKICEYYGWDYSEWDDGVRVNSESELY